jgi:predicted nucleic acid-binding Zn ribbon protein
MEISSIFVGFALFVASLAYVSLPFRQKRLKTASDASAHATQKGQRDAVLSALHELDFDFKTGKVSEEDYQPLRTQLMAEAAQYIEAEEKDAQQLEALIRTRRAAQQQGHKCEHCDAPIQAGQRFCPKCGSAVNNELCPSCGKKIQADDLFCSSCGNKIQIQMEVVAQP